jgi:hypothetical protein
MSILTTETPAAGLAPGTRVEVRCHFNCSWSRGFEVTEVEFDDYLPYYRIRRAGDRADLPALFPGTQIREESPKAL